MSAPAKLVQSPLRYPGGKQALVSLVADFLRSNHATGRHFIEPFAGGAAVSLNLVHLNVVASATIIERDPLIYAFWRCVKECPGALCERVRTLSVDLDTWRKWQPLRNVQSLSDAPLLDLGVAGLFYNRTNFSGIIGARPIGGFSQNSAYSIDCRFTKEPLIARICALREVMERINVLHGDGIAYLRRSKLRLERDMTPVYVDPPYHGQGPRLYRFHFQDRQHRNLARHLDAATYPWLVSYDNTPFIRELFERQKIVPIFLRYAVREARHADELLITNQHQLPVQLVKDQPLSMARSKTA